ncbi:MAG: hypothetical protein MOGMAGMI_00046 [Candidatus Omnitrophica bacterium]|nr:hypothetical protein [Candidatus Omnitrophota bacterium]
MKKPLFALFTIALVSVAVEALSYAALSFHEKAWASRSVLTARRDQVLASSGEIDPYKATLPSYMRPTVLHPYLGYVMDDPTERDPYGFLNYFPIVQKRSSDKIIVAITGGSVALQLYDNAIDTLIEELKTGEAFKDREIVAVRFAVGGYKQPQQLIALNYLLAVGGEYDIVINIDGFNEAVLSLSENVPKGVSPLFPRNWALQVGPLSDERLLSYVYEGARIRKARVVLARAFGARIVRDSYALHLVWENLDRFLLARKFRINREANKRYGAARTYLAQGPSRAYADDEQLRAEIVDVWQRCSRLMSELSKANGIEYFHFLQPSQYLPGSKPLTDVEMREAVSTEIDYGTHLKSVYPRMIAAGHELKKEGVHFKDLTILFASDYRTMYSDTCCHLNKEGYRIMAREIAKYVRQRYRVSTGSEGPAVR